MPVRITKAAAMALEGHQLTQERRKRQNRPRTGVGPEQAIQNACKEWCDLKHIPCERYNAGQIKAEGRLIKLASAGHSDLAGVLPPVGRAFFAEIKTPGKRPTALQQAFLDRMAAAGALAFVAHSLEEFIAAIEGAM